MALRVRLRDPGAQIRPSDSENALTSCREAASFNSQRERGRDDLGPPDADVGPHYTGHRAVGREARIRTDSWCDRPGPPPGQFGRLLKLRRMTRVSAAVAFFRKPADDWWNPAQIGPDCLDRGGNLRRWAEPEQPDGKQDERNEQDDQQTGEHDGVA